VDNGTLTFALLRFNAMLFLWLLQQDSNVKLRELSYAALLSQQVQQL